MGRTARLAAPAANTDSWPTRCSKTVSEWKGRTITYLKSSITNTKAYESFNRNILSPYRSLKTTHPVVYAIAVAALSILAAVLTFDLAFSALKHTVSAIVPIAIIVLYSQMLLLMAHNISQAQQAISKRYTV